MPKTDKPFTQKELDHYRRKLEELRDTLAQDIEQMHEDTLQNARDGSGELSGMPIHLADLGTDNYQQEFMVGVMEEETKQLQEVEAALDRIERGIYGACEDCGKRIPKARLDVVPYATLCVECKRAEEREIGY